MGVPPPDLINMLMKHIDELRRRYTTLRHPGLPGRRDGVRLRERSSQGLAAARRRAGRILIRKGAKRHDCKERGQERSSAGRVPAARTARE